MLKIDAVDVQLFLIVLFFIICCPYTKVEESFNLQAVFDILNFGINLSSYDHLQFPGVVPRTFLGSMVVSVLCVPLKILIRFFSLPELYQQIACRSVIGFLSWISFAHFRNGVEEKFGTRASQLTGVLTAFQFHICFYMSRSLPNVFALMLSLNAFAFWLKGRPMRSIALLTIATVIFRCDILILLGPFTLQLLIAREIQFVDTAYLGILTGAVSLLVTVAVDSVLWRKLVWPEGVVLFFNTVENRSSEWGVMPYHWYFSNALLKALNITIVWVLVGALGFVFPREALLRSAPAEPSLSKALQECLLSRGPNTTVLYYVAPALAFVLLYSILPHKELRFIFPALPLLTMAGGVGLDAILPVDSAALLYPLNLLHPDPQTLKMKKLDRQRLLTIGYYNIYRHTLSIVVLASLAAMTVISSGLLTASYRNYPGAEALDRLVHQHVPMYLAGHADETALHLPEKFHPLFVHIDAAAAMTGVTRFLQKRFTWTPPSASSASPPAHSNYLNLSPEHFDPRVRHCFLNPTSCTEVVDMVFYSKDENVTDFTPYDWLITADPSVALATGKFDVVEQIKAFQDIRPTWKGFVVDLRTELYILVNVADE